MSSDKNHESVSQPEDLPLHALLALLMTFGETPGTSLQNAIDQEAITFEQGQRINERLWSEFGLTPIPIMEPNVPTVVSNAEQLAYLHGCLVGSREALLTYQQGHPSNSWAVSGHCPLYLTLCDQFANNVRCALQAAIATQRESNADLRAINQCDQIARSITNLITTWPDAYPRPLRLALVQTSDQDLRDLTGESAPQGREGLLCD